MNRTYRFTTIWLLLFSVFLLLATGSILSTQAIAADLTIGNYQLVATKRINRTESEYTYKATITNTGSDVRNVTATLSIDVPGVTVLSNQLVFGNVSAGSTVTSTNTFIIRQDRNYNLNEADLHWQISAEQQTAEPAIPALRLTRVNPSSAASGAQVEIDYVAENMNAGDLRIVLDEQELLPDSVEVGKLRFTVPQGLDGGKPLFLRSDSIESNAVLFFVSETVSIVSPNEEDIITLEEDGSRVVVNHVLIFIEEGFDLDAVANAAAASEGGEVVGRIDPLRVRQLRLPTYTYEQVEAAKNRLETLSGVEFATLDIELKSDSISWAADPGIYDQRETNQVEQGAQAYIDYIHPNKVGYLKPFPIEISVLEEGIDFQLPDFSAYLGT